MLNSRILLSDEFEWLFMHVPETLGNSLGPCWFHGKGSRGNMQKTRIAFNHNFYK